jgi:hypothetical protein
MDIPREEVAPVCTRSKSHAAGWAVLAIWAALVAVGMPSNASAACPNEVLRSGQSADLPDCRAYELVTPPNMNGRIPQTLTVALTANMFSTPLVSPSRDSVLFMTLGAPLASPDSPNGTYDLYAAERSPSGWITSRRLSPSGDQSVFPNTGGVSADHLYDFINALKVQGGDGGTLSEEGIANYLGNPDGSFELIGVGTLGTERFAQGRFISPDGEHVIFVTGGGWCGFSEPCPINQLEPEAPPMGTGAIYDRGADGSTRVVSLLPGEETPAAGENAEYQGVSDNGTVIAFKVGGSLYVRINNSETKLVTSEGSVFAGVSGSGQKVFYVTGGNLFAFDIDTSITSQANSSENAEVANVSWDGSHVYFISRSQLVGSEGIEGQPNLYVWAPDADDLDFVATVSEEDLLGIPALANWTSWVVNPDNSINPGPGAESSRTTTDGKIFVFESRAQLTSYSNEGLVEIYRYDASTGTILCVSCNPSGDLPSRSARLEDVGRLTPPIVVNNLTEDGGRVFFETSESLIGRDTDGVNDIYEWSQAGVSLISSGQSPSTTATNTIFGITPDGSDVVFLSGDQLLPEAPSEGAPSLYDARVNGGFASPLTRDCLVGACQPSGSGTPALSTSGSSRFNGKGNVRTRHRCRKANHHKRYNHRRCVKKHRQQKRQGARLAVARLAGGVAK